MTTIAPQSKVSARQEERRLATLEVELWSARLGSRLFSIPALTVLRGALGDPRLRAGSATTIRVLRLIDSLIRRALTGRVVSREWSLRVRALAVLAGALDRQAGFALSERVDGALERIASLFGHTRSYTALTDARSRLHEARRWVRSIRQRDPLFSISERGTHEEHAALDAGGQAQEAVVVDELPHPSPCPLESLIHREQQARLTSSFRRVRSRLGRRRATRSNEASAAPSPS